MPRSLVSIIVLAFAVGACSGGPAAYATLDEAVAGFAAGGVDCRDRSDQSIEADESQPYEWSFAGCHEERFGWFLSVFSDSVSRRDLAATVVSFTCAIEGTEDVTYIHGDHWLVFLEDDAGALTSDGPISEVARAGGGLVHSVACSSVRDTDEDLGPAEHADWVLGPDRG